MAKKEIVNDNVAVFVMIVLAVGLFVYNGGFGSLITGNATREVFSNDSSTINQYEAKHIATKFMSPVIYSENASAYIMNSYRKGNYWEVLISIDGEGGIMGINSRSGKVEYLKDLETKENIDLTNIGEKW